MGVKNAEIARYIDNSPFLKHVGFEYVSEQAEVAVLKLTIRKEHYNMRQNLHGGIHAAMLDTTQKLLIRCEYCTAARTVNTNVHYLAPSNSGVLYARASLIQKGYLIAAVESEIFDSEENIVAKGSGVYKILR